MLADAYTKYDEQISCLIADIHFQILVLVIHRRRRTYNCRKCSVENNMVVLMQMSLFSWLGWKFGRFVPLKTYYQLIKCDDVIDEVELHRGFPASDALELVSQWVPRRVL